MNEKILLYNLPKDLKYILTAFLVCMSLGIATGLFYVYITTNMNADGITERFNGSEIIENEIPENFPKPIENMVLTTHDHLLTFSLISLSLILIFYCSSTIKGKLKNFIMIEPFIGTIIMFSSMWLMRYVSSNFSYIVILSSFITYSIWYLMIFISLYELNKK